MAVVVHMIFAGNSLDNYDAVMREAGLVGVSADSIPGAQAHYAWSEDGHLNVLDIWDSAEQFQATLAATIAPAAERAGIQLQPEVRISPLHNSIT